jgi:tripartite-type tricarboxylate transporter receptor subunit TctC
MLPLMTLAQAVGQTSAPLSAQAWPQRPIRMICPFPAGGGTDFIARLAAKHLSDRLGQQVYVENRGGANGAIGLQALMQSDPDGYTIGAISDGPIVANPALYEKLAYQPLRDFIPVAMMIRFPSMLIAHPAVGVRNVAELIALAKAKPGVLTYSSGGTGNFSHLGLELLALQTGIKLLHVPYRGGGPALAAFLAGQVDITAQAPGPVKPYVDEGRARLLASWGGKRTPELADVPTMIELGFPGVEYYIWAGLFAPKGTPAPVITRLRDAMREVMRDPQVTSVFEKAGSPPAYLDQPEFVRFVEADAARLIPAVKKIGRLDSQ